MSALPFACWLAELIPPAAMSDLALGDNVYIYICVCMFVHVLLFIWFADCVYFNVRKFQRYGQTRPVTYDTERICELCKMFC